MDLVTPSIGLIFWTSVVFVILLILLKKFAWTPILDSVDARNKSIEDALLSAEKAKQEMESLNADNERILREARAERDALLKDAREIREGMISDAKGQASAEADKVLAAAKAQINNEKMAAITELKNQVAELSIEIAEKVLKSELKDGVKQKELVGVALKEAELN